MFVQEGIRFSPPVSFANVTEDSVASFVCANSSTPSHGLDCACSAVVEYHISRRRNKARIFLKITKLQRNMDHYIKSYRSFVV